MGQHGQQREEGDKAQIRHQATRSAVGCSRPRWNCRPVALASSCKPFLSTHQLPRHNATLKMQQGVVHERLLAHPALLLSALCHALEQNPRPLPKAAEDLLRSRCEAVHPGVNVSVRQVCPCVCGDRAGRGIVM